MISDFVGSKKPGPVKPVRQAEKPPKIEPKAEAPNPDEVAFVVPEPTPEPSEPKPQKPPKSRRRHLWPADWSTKKKRLFTAGLVALLVLLVGGVAGGYYWYHQTHKPKKAVVKTEAPPAPAPTTEASRLMGVQVNIADNINKRPVIGIMVENSPDARPQAGLNQASIVFEAVAEGGITRFLALYQELWPDYVGPIRSSRPYYLDWLLPFDAAYAHVGGSPQALAEIKSLKVKDMDQFANSGAYSRVNTRYAPHNVYSSLGRLNDLAQSKGFTSSTFTSFARTDKEAPAPATATSIDFKISAPLYNPHYDYDAASNSYKRSEGGKPHTDERTGTRLAPKVVIALVMPSAPAGDGTHNSYTTTGSGQMFVFQNGQLVQGTWKKDSRSGQFSFTDAQGQPLKLSPGQTWISMVNTAGAVTYK